MHTDTLILGNFLSALYIRSVVMPLVCFQADEPGPRVQGCAYIDIWAALCDNTDKSYPHPFLFVLTSTGSFLSRTEVFVYILYVGTHNAVFHS